MGPSKENSRVAPGMPGMLSPRQAQPGPRQQPRALLLTLADRETLSNFNKVLKRKKIL